MRWQLSTNFIVVTVVAVHFWLARSDPYFASLVAGCTSAIVSIRIARQTFQFSRPAASATAIVTAMIVSSVLLTVVAVAHVISPATTSQTWDVLRSGESRE